MLSQSSTRKRALILTSHPPSIHFISTNDDLLTEILLRLPVKSLLRFKSVSKRWLSLIANPHFYRQRSSVYPSGLFVLCSTSVPSVDHKFDYIPLKNNHGEAPPQAPFRSLTFPNSPLGPKPPHMPFTYAQSPAITILQSCNGLLLCCTCSPFVNSQDYCVFNPTTRQFTILPPFLHIGGSTFDSISSIGLAYDPSSSRAGYKVVCVRTYERSSRFEIYSSQTGLWRLSSAPFPATTHFLASQNGVFWNCAIHWINEYCDTCFFFDVEKERFRELPMPPLLDDRSNAERCYLYFGESRDHLHLIEEYDHPTNTHCTVYEMRRDCSGWFVKYEVDFDAIALATADILETDPDYLARGQFSVLSVVREEVEEHSYMVMYIGNYIVVRYNFKDKSFEKIWDFTRGCAGAELMESRRFLEFGGRHAYQYIESFCAV